MDPCKCTIVIASNSMDVTHAARDDVGIARLYLQTSVTFGGHQHSPLGESPGASIAA